MPFDLPLPPTPPMDLSDSNSNSSNDYKVSSAGLNCQKVCEILSRKETVVQDFANRKNLNSPTMRN